MAVKLEDGCSAFLSRDDSRTADLRVLGLFTVEFVWGSKVHTPWIYVRRHIRDRRVTDENANECKVVTRHDGVYIQ